MSLFTFFRLRGCRIRQALLPIGSLALALGLCQCSSTSSSVRDADVVVSVKDQKLGYYREGKLVQSFKVSTSKFGVGDKPGSCQTPLGKHEVIAKIGHGLPKGAVLKSRQWNGEVLQPNAPGRDPIVSRIIWLSGLDADNHNALRRYIYIHGTTEENLLGKPASYGCVRMSMADVIDLFNEVNIGARVVITKEKLPSTEMMVAAQSKPAPSPDPNPQPASSNPPIPVDLPLSNPPGTPVEIHSEYAPGRSSSQPIIGEPTLSGKQRLLIPVGHSVGASATSKSHPKKLKHEITLKIPKAEGKPEPKKKAVTLKTSKKEGGPETSPPSKKHKADTAA